MAALRTRTSLAVRVGLFSLAAVCTLALGATSALAFELEGTADFDLSYEDPARGDITVVTIAGFDLADRHTLVLFAEYGPDAVVAGRAEHAGQLYVEVSVTRLAPGVAVRLDATDYDLRLRYEEWGSGGVSLFEGAADTGWIEIRYTKSDDELVLVDAVFSLRVTDGAEARILDGVLFGGDVPLAPHPDVRPGPRQRVRRVDHGCGGSGSIIIVDDPYYDDPYYDPYYEDDSGCGDDGYEDDPYYEDDSGCAGDEYDSGGDTYAEEDSGCAGDEYDDGSDDSYESDDSCQGDEYDDGSSTSTTEDESMSSCDESCEGDDATASAAGALRPFVRDRKPVEWLARHIHLTLPLGFWLFARRRSRERDRRQRRL